MRSNAFQSARRCFATGFMVVFLSLAACVALKAQAEDVRLLKANADRLMEELKYTEALPLWEKLATLAPKDPDVHRNLAFALLGQAANTEEAETRRQLRIRARDAFIIARDLGDDSLLVKGMIEGLSPDGRESQGFSDNAEANKLMQKGEAFFTSGKLDEAFKAYQEALALDPRCYYAALFSGDVMMHTEKFDEAEKWYQRAIKIDPYQETAYRYSATPLMKQKKFDQARERYIEAFITAPYSRLAVNGFVQWAQATNTPVGHPRLDIPKVTVDASGKKNTTINVNPLSDDGSMAWIAYSATREEWEKGKFAKAYPNEKTYRHSVAEEVDALRSVLSMAKSLKPKKLNEQFAMIEAMDKDGVLEAFVIMAIPDEGIAVEHAQYLRKNRDKLRLYVTKYVIGAGQK